MKNWNQDHYTKKARKDHYYARSVFKLEEIARKEKLFEHVTTIIDLGASPGSWTQFCLQHLPSHGRVIAIDPQPIHIVDKRVTLLQDHAEQADLTSLFGSKVDLILSDMAPRTSGIHTCDTALSYELCLTAVKLADCHLKPGGSLVVKLFMGDEFKSLESLMIKKFGYLRLLRPLATRKKSREIYFVAKKFMPEVSSNF